MSMFAQHIAATRNGGRMPVSLGQEGTEEAASATGAVDDFNGVVTEEPIKTETDEGPEVGQGEDQFAEQRAALNARMAGHQMIRSDVTAEADDGGMVETPAAKDEINHPVDGNLGEDVVIAQPGAAPEVDGKAVEDVKDSGDIDFTDEAAVAPAADATGEDGVVTVVDVPEIVTAPDAEPETDAGEDDDYDDGYDAPLAEPELDDIIRDTAELEAMCQSLNTLDGAFVAIESYGVNPSMMGVSHAMGLFNGTALESLGLESFGYAAPEDDDSVIALEALGEKIASTTANWSAKVLSVVKNFGGKILSGLSTIYSSVTGAVTKLGSFAWDKTKMAGKTIKAHPYATIIAIIGAIAAVGGVAIYAGASMPMVGAKAAELQTFAKGVAGKVNAIKWPFGKVAATVADDTAKIGVVLSDSTAIVPVAQSAEKLGWTSSLVKSAGSKLSAAYKATVDGIGAAKGRITKLGGSAAEKVSAAATAGKAKAGAAAKAAGAGYDKVAGVGDKVAMQAALGAKAAGASGRVAGVAGTITHFAFMSAAFSIASAIVKLVYKIVMAGLRAIASTFRALVGASGSAAPAAA